MKAVELRSLNLLEGGLLGGGKGATRGVPMAATRSMGNLCNGAQAPPSGAGIAATQAPSQQQQPAGNGVAAAPAAAAQQHQQPAAGAPAPRVPHVAMQAAPLVPPHSSAS